MELTIPERLSLLEILPAQGSIVTLRVLQELRMMIAFTEEELKKWKITTKRTNDGQGAFVTWDEDFSKEVTDLSIGSIAVDIVKRELVKLDQESRLRTNMISLYEKFVDGKGTENLHK